MFYDPWGYSCVLWSLGLQLCFIIFYDYNGVLWSLGTASVVSVSIVFWLHQNKQGLKEKTGLWLWGHWYNFNIYMQSLNTFCINKHPRYIDLQRPKCCKNTCLTWNFLSDKANNYIVSRSDSNKRYYEPDFRMLECFIDNIFVMFDCPAYAWHTWCWTLNNNHIMLGGHVFQQTVFLFSQICSFIRMKRTSLFVWSGLHTGDSQVKTNGSYASFNFMFPIAIQVWRLYCSHFAGQLLDPLYFESLSRCSILSVGTF